MESSARCGTTSLSIGPSSTGAKATHGASLDNWLHRTDSLACSYNGLLRPSPDIRLPRQTHSPAPSPDLCATPDNQLPRTDSLTGSFTRSTCASSPINYPGTQMPVASRQQHIAPDYLASAARIQQHNNPTPQRSSTPVVSSLSSSPPNPLLCRG